jgi:hypothetical protein
LATTPNTELEGAAFVDLLNHVCPPVVPLVAFAVAPVPPAPIEINADEIPARLIDDDDQPPPPPPPPPLAVVPGREPPPPPPIAITVTLTEVSRSAGTVQLVPEVRSTVAVATYAYSPIKEIGGTKLEPSHNQPKSHITPSGISIR